MHGSDRVYRKFLKAAEFYDAQVLVLGGDLTGKAIVPIVKTPNGGYLAQLHGEHHNLAEQGLGEFVKRVQDTGYYPHVMSQSEYDKLKDDKDKVRALFEELMAKLMRDWVELAEKRLGHSGVRVFISPGNDDSYAIDPALSSSKFVVNPEGRILDLDGYQLVTLGITNPTPWHTPREQSDEELYKTLRNLIGQSHRYDNMIFNLHCPPYGTPLDLAPKLDDKLQPVMSGGEVEIIHVGSVSVRKCIEEFQPLVGLHGHIHEARSVCRIGRTLCINPGSEYGEGLLRGAIVDLKDGRLKNYALTAG